MTAQERPRLGSPLTKSVVVHTILLVCILLLGGRQSERIQQKEEQVNAGLRGQREAEESLQRKEQEELARQQLQDEVMERLAEIVDEEVEEEDESQLLDEIQLSLEENFEAAAAEQEIATLSDADESQLQEDLFRETFDDVQRSLDDMLKAAILAEVRRHIREDVAPALKERIEETLASRSGSVVKKELASAAKRERSEQIKAAKEQVQQAQQEFSKLAKEQADVTNTARRNPDDAAPKQQSVADKATKAQQLASAAVDEAKRKSPQSAAKTDSARKSLDGDDLEQAMEQASEKLDSGNAKEAAAASDAAKKQFEKQAKMLSELGRELDSQARQRTVDELGKTLSRAVLGQVEQKVRDAVTREVKQTAIPKAAGRITEQLSQRLSDVGWKEDAFREKVERAIESALDQELSGRSAVDPSAAVQAAKSELGVSSLSQQLDTARKALDASVERLSDLSKKQADARQFASDSSASASAQEAAADQSQLAADVGDAVDEAANAVAKAQEATDGGNAALDAAASAISEGNAASDAKSAAADLAAGKVAEAIGKQAAASESLARAAAKLSQASKSIAVASQQAAVSEQQTAAADTEALEGALDAEGAAEAVDAVVEAASGPVVASVADSVKKASEARQKTSLSPAARSRIARLEQLGDKLAQVDRNIAAGRQTVASDSGESETTSDSDDSSDGDSSDGEESLDGGEAIASGGGGARDGDQSSKADSSGGSGGSGGGGSFSSGPYDNNWGARDGRGFNSYAKLNREVYDLYKIVRTQRPEDSTLANIYGDLTATTDLASQAAGAIGSRPKCVYVDATPKDAAVSVPGERSVEEPSFASIVFGAADFQPTPIAIDGDLADWGKRKHLLKMRWSFNGERLEDGIPLCLRWSPGGFYFCYHVPARTKIDPILKRPYEGDCFELWTDVDNLRKASMSDSPFSQQFCFMPFGANGDENITFAEVGRGFRGINRFAYLFEKETDIAKARARCVGRFADGGYTVEGFLSKRALARPRLKAGMIVAMNFSINRGYDFAKSQQWSMPKSVEAGGFDKPDTWGDILLLGTDGDVRFVDAANPATRSRGVVPGQPVAIEVHDPDMNNNPDHVESILTSVRVRGSQSYLYVILQETAANSGVFRGSFNTQPPYLPRRDNTLDVRSGQWIEVEYKDPRGAFGERDRRVATELQMGAPVFRINPQ